MSLNLKVKGSRKIKTKSFSLSKETAEFIEQTSAQEGCSASNFVEALVSHYKATRFNSEF